MKRLYWSKIEQIQELANKESWIKWGQSPNEVLTPQERANYYKKTGEDYLLYRKNKGVRLFW